jgi:hypothetical protein
MAFHRYQKNNHLYQKVRKDYRPQKSIPVVT